MNEQSRFTASSFGMQKNFAVLSNTAINYPFLDIDPKPTPFREATRGGETKSKEVCMNDRFSPFNSYPNLLRALEHDTSLPQSTVERYGRMFEDRLAIKEYLYSHLKATKIDN